MLIGVPKETKSFEYRVGISPQGVKRLTHHGHKVMIETKAGHEIGFLDSDYIAAGAIIADNADKIYQASELIVKVKEPQLDECTKLNSNQIIFSYLHLAAVPEIASALMKSGCTAIAYETVTNANGSLPLLSPMSDIAGRISVQVGAFYLQRNNGGRGVLLSGVDNVEKGNVVIIGGGTVGLGAAIIARGLGAKVTILDKSPQKLMQLKKIFLGSVNCIGSTYETIEENLLNADLVIGAVLVPGAKAPHVVNKSLVEKMKHGSVIVDVAIDQGGCIETSIPTTHENPIFFYSNVIHYCVTNMPSAVARTASYALEHATLPYILKLADKGISIFEQDHYFSSGLNIDKGKIVHEQVAKSLSNLK